MHRMAKNRRQRLDQHGRMLRLYMPASIVAICLFFEGIVQFAVAPEKRSFMKQKFNKT